MMTARAYSRVCNSPGTNCTSYVRIRFAADSSPTYAWNQLGVTSPYRCHHPGVLASLASATSRLRSSSSWQPYRVSRSAMSRSLKLTRPSSIRLIFDSEDRISHPAASRLTPRASRNFRSWVPRRRRSTVGPLAEPPSG